MTSALAQIATCPLEPGREAAWDAFVSGHPDATFFHRVGWSRVVESAFGHKTHYLCAERDGEICGILPLVHINSRLFSNGLVSNAFCVYGGPVATDEAARRALDAAAIEMMGQVGAAFVEYRNLTASRTGWVCKDDLYVTFRRAISESTDDNLKAIPRKQRAVIRKAIKAEELRDEIDDGVDRLFDVYAVSVRNLGTPVFPKRYFRLLKEEFGDDCQILTIVGPDGTPLSAVMSFLFRDEVLPYYGGGTAEARRYGANDFMYWRVMDRAAADGIKVFDFGRSKQGTGSFAFKKHWGFTPQPLFYEFHLRDGAEPPDINPLNPKYQMFIAMWKRLPVPVANLVGPHIVRNLG